MVDGKVAVALEGTVETFHTDIQAWLGPDLQGRLTIVDECTVDLLLMPSEVAPLLERLYKEPPAHFAGGEVEQCEMWPVGASIVPEPQPLEKSILDQLRINVMPADFPPPRPRRRRLTRWIKHVRVQSDSI